MITSLSKKSEVLTSEQNGLLELVKLEATSWCAEEDEGEVDGGREDGIGGGLKGRGGGGGGRDTKEGIREFLPVDCTTLPNGSEVKELEVGGGGGGG